MTNREIRAEAWRLMVHGRWFSRVLNASIALLIAANLVRALACRLVPSGPFALFVVLLTGGIIRSGYAAIALAAARNDTARPYARAFGGWLRPFACLWRNALAVLVTFAVALLLAPVADLNRFLFRHGGVAGAAIGTVFWIVDFLLVVGILYRLYFYWYVAQDDSVSAVDAMKRTFKLTKGRVFALCRLDCSYWRWHLVLFVSLLPGLGVVMNSLLAWIRDVCRSMNVDAVAVLGLPETIAYPVPPIIGNLSLLVSVLVLAVVWVYMRIGHAIFYRELVDAARDEHREGATA